MTCERRELAIAKLVGGDLSLRRAARLSQHVEGCPRCRALYDDLAAQQSVLQDFAPRDLDSAAHVNIESVFVHAESSSLRHAPRAIAGALIAACLVGVVALRLTVQEQSSAPAASPIVDTVNESVSEFATNPVPIRHANVKIQIMTDNPDVVIYWLGDPAGE